MRGRKRASAEAPASPTQASPAFQNLIVPHAPASGHGPAAAGQAGAYTAPAPGAPAAATDPGIAERAAAGVQLTGAGNGQWRLQVAPPGLGPVHIDLGLQQGQGVNAQFWVQHPAAASTIQGGLAELRGALASGGLSLGRFGVALGSGGGRQPEGRQRPAARSSGPLRRAMVGAVAAPRSISMRGLDVVG